MTSSYDYLAQLRSDWLCRGRSRPSREAFRVFRDAHPELALHGLVDLYDVVLALETRGGRSVVERAHIVTALLQESSEEIIRRALLQTLLPGVVSVCRQLRFGRGIISEPHETLATAISLLAELLVDWAGQSRTYAAPDLISALRCRLRRWLLKEKEALQHESFAFDDEPVALDASPLLTRLENLREGPHQRLAQLTYRSVFAGVSLRELARDDHSSVPRLKQELQTFALTHLLG
jgi:hypothetical protein